MTWIGGGGGGARRSRAEGPEKRENRFAPHSDGVLPGGGRAGASPARQPAANSCAVSAATLMPRIRRARPAISFTAANPPRCGDPHRQSPADGTPSPPANLLMRDENDRADRSAGCHPSCAPRRPRQQRGYRRRRPSSNRESTSLVRRRRHEPSRQPAAATNLPAGLRRSSFRAASANADSILASAAAPQRPSHFLRPGGFKPGGGRPSLWLWPLLRRGSWGRRR